MYVMYAILMYVREWVVGPEFEEHHRNSDSGAGERNSVSPFLRVPTPLKELLRQSLRYQGKKQKQKQKQNTKYLGFLGL